MDHVNLPLFSTPLLIDLLTLINMYKINLVVRPLNFMNCISSFDCYIMFTLQNNELNIVWDANECSYDDLRSSSFLLFRNKYIQNINCGFY